MVPKLPETACGADGVGAEGRDATRERPCPGPERRAARTWSVPLHHALMLKDDVAVAAPQRRPSASARQAVARILVGTRAAGGLEPRQYTIR